MNFASLPLLAHHLLTPFSDFLSSFPCIEPVSRMPRRFWAVRFFSGVDFTRSDFRLRWEEVFFGRGSLDSAPSFG